MRYKFYREHKYVSFALNSLEQLIAKTDFRNTCSIKEVNKTFKGLSEMLKGHALYEDENLHSLLKEKGSNVHEHIEEDHKSLDRDFETIQSLLNLVLKAKDEEEKIELGYLIYLTYRKFVADNLIHLHEEETKILPELQRLYSDSELRKVEFDTYRRMTPEQMIHMIQTLFPHMNPNDKKAFLTDIKDSEPQKFALIWDELKTDVE